MSKQTAPVLSKSRFVSGLQCAKKLWTEVHARERIPPWDAATRARFDQGHEVGDLARGLFPGGLEIGPGVRRWDRVVADTQRALSQRRPLYEAAFRYDLRNRSNEEAEIHIRDRIPGDWKLLDSSAESSRPDASTLAFRIKVPAGGEAVISYRVRVR